MALAGSVMLLLADSANAVDGVVEINEARALPGSVTPGDLPGYPVTLDQPGSYQLTSDLSVSGPNDDAIQITASDVSVDLNGFTVRCVDACDGLGVGVLAARPAENASVSNGTVRNMGSHGSR